MTKLVEVINKHSTLVMMPTKEVAGPSLPRSVKEAS